MSGLYCPRCGRYQMPGSVSCAECGASLLRTRWVAYPPRPYAPVGPAPVAPYSGPPSYHGRAPQWGFPPVIWHREGPVRPPAVSAPHRGLLLVTALAVMACLACLVAGGAELFRFVLIARGRTEVLSADTVKLSDALVTASSLVALLTAAATAIALISLLGQLSAFAADRAGLVAPRDSSSRLARLLIPGFNLYGAGQVLAEVDVLLRRGARPDPERGTGVVRPGLRVMIWWAGWVLNGALVIALIWRASASGLQAVADSVELHVAVNLTGAVVAGILVAVLRGFRRSLEPPRPVLKSWTVLPPVGVRPGADRAAGSAAAVTADESEAGASNDLGAARVDLTKGEPALAVADSVESDPVAADSVVPDSVESDPGADFEAEGTDAADADTAAAVSPEALAPRATHTATLEAAAVDTETRPSGRHAAE